MIERRLYKPKPTAGQRRFEAAVAAAVFLGLLAAIAVVAIEYWTVGLEIDNRRKE